VRVLQVEIQWRLTVFVAGHLDKLSLLASEFDTVVKETEQVEFLYNLLQEYGSTGVKPTSQDLVQFDDMTGALEKYHVEKDEADKFVQDSKNEQIQSLDHAIVRLKEQVSSDLSA
jgi:hypothetical protein